MIQVHEMEIFLAAAEEENFSAAARRLHLSQPAVSFQIQSLEHRLNIQLFHRNGRRIALTEAGRELLPLAREMVNLSLRIEESVCARQGLVKGQLVIGCSTSPGKYILPRLVGAFRKLFPRVQVSVQVADRQAVEDKLIGQEFHLGVVGLCSKRKELECWPFFTDELALIVASGHPWAACATIPPAELSTAEWVLREAGAVSRQLVAASLAECGVAAEDLPVAMELGSDEAVAAAVEAGHGVSFVSRVTAQHGLDLGRIKTVQVDGLSVRREIYLARVRARTGSCAELHFRDYVASPEGQRVMGNAAA